MATIEYKNVHIYEQVLNYQKSTQLLDLLQQFPSEFKTDPFLVAVTHHHPIFNQVDLDQSRKIYIDLVAQNHPYAMNTLAWMYGYGQGVEINYQKAIDLYEQAIKLKNPNAMNNLALMYASGKGVETNYQKAINLYEQAIDLNDANAMHNLADMYVYPKFTESTESTELYDQAVPKFTESTDLGYMYKNVESKLSNYQKAAKMYQRAVDLGHHGAMNNLAGMYKYGQGVIVDYQKAIELYERAVNAGVSCACCNLADMYERGLGVKKNLCRALDLYLQVKATKYAQRIVDHCSDLEEKMNMFKICIKYDFYLKYSRMYVVVLMNMWLIDIVSGIYLHQKHPLYNRHIDGLIAQYM